MEYVNLERVSTHTHGEALEEKPKTKSRILWLDIVKSISIILVVFCHTPLLKSNSILDNISMIICWAAVPCFFMSTGALYLNKEVNFKRYIKKLLTIYLIVCIWKFIYLIFYNCIGKIDIFNISKRQIFNYVILFTGLKGVVDGHFWFMYAYLSIFMIYPIFNLCFNNKNYKYFLITIMIAIFVFSILPGTLNAIFDVFKIKNVNINNIKTINPFGGYSHMLLYFLIGGFLYKYNLYEKYNKKLLIRIISIIMIFIGITGLVLIKKHYQGTFEWKGLYLKNGYYWTSTIILSIGMFIFFQGINVKNKIFNKCVQLVGASTMGIFYMHILLLEFIKKINITHFGTAINLLKSIIIVCLCCLITYILKKIPYVKKLVQ